MNLFGIGGRFFTLQLAWYGSGYLLGTATVTAPEEGRDDWCGDAGKSRFRSTAEHQGTQWSDLVVSGDPARGASFFARALLGLGLTWLDWRGTLELVGYTWDSCLISWVCLKMGTPNEIAI